MRTYYLEQFSELNEEEKMVSWALRIISIEGISIDVARNVLMPENPYNFDYIIDLLKTLGWLYIDVDTIYSHKPVEETVYEIITVKDKFHEKIFSTLLQYLTLQPLDDMYARREYFVAARLYLSTVYTVLNTNNECLVEAFAKVVLAYARHVELGFSKKREQTFHIDRRIDIRLLSFLNTIVEGTLKGLANMLLGLTYNYIFMYDEARECFKIAEDLLGRHAELMACEAMMYYNLSIPWKSLKLLYNAYLQNEYKGKKDENIYISLRIAFLCALYHEIKSARMWLQRAQNAIGTRKVPAHHLYDIIMREIDAFLNIDDRQKAIQILDATELEIYRLYGAHAPEMAVLAFIHHCLDDFTWLERESIEHYRKYVEINHYNYGYNKGDTAMLYSAYMSVHNSYRNLFTAGIYVQKMQEMNIEDSSTAPGVRLGHAITNFITYLSVEDYDVCEKNLKNAQRIYKNELKPNEEDLREIQDIFHDGIVPEEIAEKENLRFIQYCEYLLLTANKETEKTEKHVLNMIKTETSSLYRKMWEARLGLISAREGNVEEAVTLWQNLVDISKGKDKFTIAKYIADIAKNNDMMTEAQKFIEKALDIETMLSAPTHEIAEALCTQAEILNYFGLKGSKEPWEQAELLFRSLGDNDGLAMLYLTWAILLQDSDKERLIKKAISLWKPEKTPFDEMLSTMYHQLTIALGTIGKYDEAMKTARKAINLYPVSYPYELYEEIKDYL